MAFQWHERIIGADPNSPSSYNPIGDTPPDCPGAGFICAVYSDTDPATNQPILDNPLKAQMILALNSGQDQQRVLLRMEN